MMHAKPYSNMSLAAAIVATHAESEPDRRGLKFAVVTLHDTFFARTEEQARAFVRWENLTRVEAQDMLAAQIATGASDGRSAEPSLAERPATALAHIEQWRRIARLQVSFERTSHSPAGRAWWRNLCAYRRDDAKTVEQFLRRLHALREQYILRKSDRVAECDWWEELRQIVDGEHPSATDFIMAELRRRLMPEADNG